MTVTFLFFTVFPWCRFLVNYKFTRSQCNNIFVNIEKCYDFFSKRLDHFALTPLKKISVQFSPFSISCLQRGTSSYSG